MRHVYGYDVSCRIAIELDASIAVVESSFVIINTTDQFD